MNKKIRWITETGLMLALLVSLQAITKPLGQMVTGSCVNTILAISALVGGLSCGITVALISPVLAFLLGIAPMALTVPAIMAGNTVYVIMLSLLAGKKDSHPVKQVVAWIVAAAAKFSTLYILVAELICGILAESLIASGAMKPPMVQALPVTFGLPQLITALIGGAVALILVPTLKKALKK